VSSAALAALFLLAALVSLGMSWLLVSRLERVGERLGLSEGLLGLVAALAADAPEITAAITALVHHEQHVGAGVILGSNLFNLAALLGLGAVAAGRIALHRKVVVLGGAFAVPVAGACVLGLQGVVSPSVSLAIGSIGLLSYAIVLAEGSKGLGRLALPRRWVRWLGSAVAEEEAELAEAIHPRRGTFGDAIVVGASLVTVVVASIAMERLASSLGRRYAVPQIVIGALVLAAVTSLPNAVAGIYLASKGRGAAALSTSLNSNSINVTLGLLLPAAVVGLGKTSTLTTLLAVWWIGLSTCILISAYRSRGLGRGAGIVIVCAYLIFVGWLLTNV
jgi:cation:H+ antiporter